MALFQEQVPGQNQVEVDEDPAAGPAGPELVQIDPDVFAVPGDDPGDLLQQRRVRGVHEAGAGLAHQTHPGDQDVEAHQDGHRAVQPVGAGKLDRQQPHQDAPGGVDVGEHVLAVGDEDQGMGALPHHYQGQAQGEIDQRRPQDEGEAAFQPGDALGVKEAGPGLIKDAGGRGDDQGAFKAGGKEFDLAVAVRVSGVGALGGKDDAAQGKAGRHHVDDGLQGVGEDGGGAGEPEGEELHRHQPQADGQGGGDGDEAALEVHGFRVAHGFNFMQLIHRSQSPNLPIDFYPA